MPAPHPTLIATEPLNAAGLALVHAAQVDHWNVIRTVGGRFPGDAIAGAVAMYGHEPTLISLARFNQLYLLAPTENWLQELPSDFVAGESSQGVEDTRIFEYEFRCWLADGVVETLSPFRHLGGSCQVRGRWVAPEHLHDEAAQFCERLMNQPDVEPPPAVALDVGYDSQRGWLALAAHACWNAAYFGCAPVSILEVLKASCRTRLSLAAHEQHWVRD